MTIVGDRLGDNRKNARLRLHCGRGSSGLSFTGTITGSRERRFGSIRNLALCVVEIDTSPERPLLLFAVEQAALLDLDDKIALRFHRVRACSRADDWGGDTDTYAADSCYARSMSVLFENVVCSLSTSLSWLQPIAAANGQRVVFDVFALVVAADRPTRLASIRVTDDSHRAAASAAAEKLIAAIGLEPCSRRLLPAFLAYPEPFPVSGSTPRMSLASPSQIPARVRCQSR